MQRRTSGSGPAGRSAPKRVAATRGSASRAGATRSAGVAAGGRSGSRDSGRVDTRRATGVGARPTVGVRPASARRTAAKRTTAPRQRRLTGRALVLMVILVALAFGYTYPVRVYLSQKAEIAQLQADQRARAQRIVGLEEQVALWQDPAYVASQARKRFYYVRPGERPYITWDAPQLPAPAAQPQKPQPRGWSQTLWSSIGSADRQTRP
ncbi:septum formation initiator family protein [Pilimelia columellifera]|uniref:Cell division protein FtsB n=1 Tax=Pilimelia columellifera subsp. columellifera TaxID=706583 RepID=A0ABP6AVN9_9ACTN